MRKCMQIQIEIVKENEDGSADAKVHFDAEGLGVLVEAGIIDILRQYIAQEKRKTQLRIDLADLEGRN